MKQNLFNSVKMTKPRKNVFDLSNDVKSTCNMGELVPVFWDEFVPGDKVTIGCESLIRFAPLISPMMHRVDVSVHYFFVPFRLLWSSWENYITNGGTVDGGTFPLTMPTFPYVDLTVVNWGDPGGLADQLGIPTPVGGNTERVSAMPFAAYQLIYDEYYRDQNLIERESPAPGDGTILGDGDNDANWASGVIGQLRNRCWEHDYFTSALPFAQKGDPVNIPIGAFHDVSVLAKEPPTTPGDTAVVLDGVGVPSGNPDDQTVPFGTPDVSVNDLYAETSELTAEAATITDLRRAFRLQEWLEKAARSGSRYFENILAFFGLRSPDARLQRPEYITGVKKPVQVSEVLATAETTNLPQGNMAGHGVAAVDGRYGSYFVQEHGIIMGIMSIMPKTAYQQGLEKKWLKINDPMEFFWPQFEHIGEQEIVKKEVFAFQGATGEEVFGYIPRYSEYKYCNNRVAGYMRNTFDYWHLGRIFASAGDAVLDADFVVSDPADRVFAVVDTHNIIFHHLNKISAVRPMAKFGNPSF